MRISSAALVVLMAGCHAPPATSQVDTAADDGRILCARGDAALARACTVDRLKVKTGTVLILRHPDGAFRRLLVTTADGRGIVAADGAEVARVAKGDGDTIDVALGDARYRFPRAIGQR